MDERKLKAAEQATEKVFSTLDWVLKWGILLACIGLVGWVAFNLLETFGVSGLKLWALTGVIGLFGGWLLTLVFRVMAFFQ